MLTDKASDYYYQKISSVCVIFKAIVDAVQAILKHKNATNVSRQNRKT
jgi:hypothetical protein